MKSLSASYLDGGTKALAVLVPEKLIQMRAPISARCRGHLAKQMDKAECSVLKSAGKRQSQDAKKAVVQG